MTDQEEIRLLGISAPVLLRLLRKREDRILNKIYGEFTTGKHDQLTNLAEWVSVRSQIHEMNSALRNNEDQEEKRHANTRD
jgi:hypothetical protein